MWGLRRTFLTKPPRVRDVSNVVVGHAALDVVPPVIVEVAVDVESKLFKIHLVRHSVFESADVVGHSSIPFAEKFCYTVSILGTLQ